MVSFAHFEDFQRQNNNCWASCEESIIGKNDLKMGQRGSYLTTSFGLQSIIVS